MSKQFDPKKYYHTRYFKLKNEHKCVCCGEPLAESNKGLMCVSCREKNRAAQRKYYQKKKREELLRALRTTWISVENGLPNEFESVLGYMPDAGDFPPVRECYLVGGTFFFPALADRHPVTHWMPLPEPPKMKGGE